MDTEEDKQVEELFATPEEKLAKVHIPLKHFLSEEELNLLCENPSILRKKIEEISWEGPLCGTANIKRIALELLARLERTKEIVAGMTRCRRCGYTFYMEEKSAECPKCRIGHIRP